MTPCQTVNRMIDAIPPTLFLVISTMFFPATAQPAPKTNTIYWKNLAPIPDSDGYAGSFAGISNHALIVAGGANFPNNGRPWNKDPKVWHDAIFVLEKPDGNWKKAGKLPKPSGYGASITWRNKLICIGGGNASENFTDVFSITYQGGSVIFETLPSLPVALINSCGVLLNNSIYIFGGIETPAATRTTGHFYKLDLLQPEGKQLWERLPSFLGKDRMLATAGALGNDFYMVGGIQLVKTNDDNTSHREYLNDAWRFSQEKGWQQIANLPYTLAAAPTPACTINPTRFLVIGGDDGAQVSNVAALKDNHPGFRNDILEYDAAFNTWSMAGYVTTKVKIDALHSLHGSVYAPVTTPLVVWNDCMVIPGGEAKPGSRTNKVLARKIKH
jgi:N-acetylneuraminic acid mutarotase